MSTPKKSRVRHRVRVGDVVRFYSPIENHTGWMGAVVNVPSRKFAIVKSERGRYAGASNCLWVVYTQKPRGVDQDGEKLHFQSMYITEVVFRRKKYQPDPPKPQPIVLHTMDQLKDHLTSADAHRKVVFIPLTEGQTA